MVRALTDEVDSGNVESIFHIGDISYATGFLVEWDFFLQLISPVASQVSYMTAIGNHERYLFFLILFKLFAVVDANTCIHEQGLVKTIGTF